MWPFGAKRKWTDGLLLMPAAGDSGILMWSSVHGYTIKHQILMNSAGCWLLRQWTSGQQETTISVFSPAPDISAAFEYLQSHDYDIDSRADDARSATLLLYKERESVETVYRKSPQVQTPNPVNCLLNQLTLVAGIPPVAT